MKHTLFQRVTVLLYLIPTFPFFWICQHNVPGGAEAYREYKELFHATITGEDTTPPEELEVLA